MRWDWKFYKDSLLDWQSAGYLRQKVRNRFELKTSATWRSALGGPMALRPTLTSSLPLSIFNEQSFRKIYKSCNFFKTI
jgi:hypothetical protein